MPSLNLYKIDILKFDECLQKLSSADKVSQKDITYDEHLTFNLMIYIFKKKETNDLVTWNWVLNEFNLRDVCIC